MVVECWLYISTKFAGLLTFKPDIDGGNKDSGKDLDLPLIEIETIAKATNNFSLNNKLGEGGFGPVYKVCRFLTHPRLA